MTELQASGAGARVSHPADERQARYGVHPAQAHRFIEAPEHLHHSAPQSRLLYSQKVSRGPPSCTNRYSQHNAFLQSTLHISLRQKLNVYTKPACLAPQLPM